MVSALEMSSSLLENKTKAAAAARGIPFELKVNLPVFPHLREDEVCAAAQAVVDFYRN
jgi:hypothetical protein